ncbi:hypothetical protein IJ579_02605 [bacterium]|nr:hypothetical protein [bacterium]
MPEAKGKHICLKLGAINLSQSELTSINALVDLMESKLACLSTSSALTLEAATALNIKVSEFTNEVEAPTFKSVEEKSEVEGALDNIFSSTELPKDDKEVVKVVRQNDDVVSELEPEENDETQNLPTLYLRKTIRSGQSISSDGNIIIIGDVNPGAEIIAKGDITVWGILGGIAHAGSDGNNYARIRALKLNPVQIRIGEIFARRPDSVNMPYIQKTSEYVPEEAFAYKGSIVIKKIHNGN